MKILVHNDMKQKPMSWTASVSVHTSHGSGHYSLDASAYGATEAEAVDAIQEIMGVISKLALPTERVYVDYKGEPLKPL